MRYILNIMKTNVNKLKVQDIVHQAICRKKGIPLESISLFHSRLVETTYEFVFVHNPPSEAKPFHVLLEIEDIMESLYFDWPCLNGDLTLKMSRFDLYRYGLVVNGTRCTAAAMPLSRQTGC
ncbi:MAG: hypothetical protein HUN04_01975 [Desulfobacter sp.]|nr:MAG: hypothetical protein HUN04_01975 [Desulfobacter sp.]